MADDRIQTTRAAVIERAKEYIYSVSPDAPNDYVERAACKLANWIMRIRRMDRILKERNNV